MTKLRAMEQTTEILYVDDSVEDQLLATEAVAELGRAVDLRIAESAIEMWTALNNRLEYGEPLPAVLVIDLRMPEVNGHRLLEKLRTDPSLSVLPVVVLSTSSDPDDIATATTNGAMRYETKPDRFEEMIAVWERVVELAERV